MQQEEEGELGITQHGHRQERGKQHPGKPNEDFFFFFRAHPGAVRDANHAQLGHPDLGQERGATRVKAGSGSPRG